MAKMRILKIILQIIWLMIYNTRNILLIKPLTDESNIDKINKSCIY